MKDRVWKLITLCASISTAYAIERYVWSPTCTSSNEKELIPHPGDCRKFFFCLEGIAYPLLCPYGLSWNPTLNECSTMVACENKEYTKVPQYNPLCPIDENPANPTHLADAFDCGKFYECQGGFAFHMKCPVGQDWNVDRGKCEDAIVANCKRSQIVIGNGEPNPLCPTKEDQNNPTQLPHPEDCTKFYKCSFGRSYVMSCPFGLHWDVDNRRCESPFIAQCASDKVTRFPPIISTQTSTSPSKTTSIAEPNTSLPPNTSTSPSKSTSTAKPNTNLPTCPKDGIKNFGIPGQCDKYFSCSQGKLYIMTCRAGRQWSEAVGGCVEASQAGCTGIIGGFSRSTAVQTTSSTLSSYSTTKQSSVTPRPTSCAPGVTFLSHPTDCHKYLMCDNHKPVEMLCPGGLFFSHTTSSCQWSNIDC